MENQAEHAERTLFHPLVSLEWQCCKAFPVLQHIQDTQAVVLNNKVFVGASDRLDPSGRCGLGTNDTVCVYDISGDSWDKIQCPTYQHAVTVYNNQLALIGGVYHSTKACTNKLWVLQEEWTQSLPPMPTKRCNASAVGIGNHLAVAGGNEPGRFSVLPLDTVEIYDGHGWTVAESLPKPSYCMNSVLQGDTWYLMGGKEQGREVYHTSLENLIATTSSNPATPVWRKLPDVHFENSTPAVFMNELIAIGGKESADLHTWHHGVFVPKFTSKIHAYSTSTRSWVHVGDMPLYHNYDSTCATTLPSGELFLVEGTVLGKTQEVHFPGGCFTMSAIARLAAVANINLCYELAPRHREMIKKLSLPQSLSYNPNPVDTIRTVFEEWLAGKSRLPPTWGEMMEVLREVGMVGLALRIEKYFTENAHTPNLVELITFPGKSKEINIPAQIGTKYTSFGILLLNDSNAAQVKSIETKYHEDAQEINLEILRQWIEGSGKQPVTWRTLVDVLCKIGLTTLADEIKAVKL